jgi:sugar lactone lactonase YvrE
MVCRWMLLALLLGLRWASVAGATALDDVADRQLGQPSFVTRGVNLVDARGLASPSDVAIDRRVTPNRLYVADSQNSRVLGWSDAGGFATGAPADLVIGQPDFASSDCPDPPSAASLCAPRAVAVDKFGNLYVADTDASRVLEYDTPFTTDAIADVVFGQDGSFTSSVCDAAANGLCNPIAVALDVATNLYVIDSGNERVLVYAKPVLFEDTVPDLVIPATCGSVSATSLCQPRALAVDAADGAFARSSLSGKCRLP